MIHAMRFASEPNAAMLRVKHVGMRNEFPCVCRNWRNQLIICRETAQAAIFCGCNSIIGTRHKKLDIKIRHICREKLEKVVTHRMRSTHLVAVAARFVVRESRTAAAVRRSTAMYSSPQSRVRSAKAMLESGRNRGGRTVAITTY